MDASNPQPLKVGELARRTGISVRALHHYDEIGLLRPSRRTAAGHRLYVGGDVARLLRIRALQQLGFSLDEIRGCIDDSERFSPVGVLAARLARLGEQIAAAERLRRRLEDLQRHIDEDTPLGEFLDVLQEMTMFEKYYTPEQLAELQRRRDDLGDDTIAEVEAEWPRLIAAVRAAKDAGTPPDDPEVRRLAARWQELVRMFTGGDPGIRRSLANLHAGEPETSRQHGLDPELMAYVQRASGGAVDRG